MNIVTALIKSKSVQQANNMRDSFYLHHFNQLQGMIDAYCHTGNNYYLEQAQRERQECFKLKQYKF
jgi:hypothetical protein